MSEVVGFLQQHGLLVDAPIGDGRWHRVATDDHPKKKNGAYLWDGERVVCQNWATMAAPAILHGGRAWNEPIARKNAQRRVRTQQQDWAQAAQRAHQLIRMSKLQSHPYLEYKGFGPRVRGLVATDGRLLIPMRHWRSDELQSVQWVEWLPEERRYEKKFMPGGRAKGAVHRMGRGTSMAPILCEGYATGMSIIAGLNYLSYGATVVVCFSAGNLTYVARELRQRCVAWADNDPVQTDPEKARAAPGCAGELACIDADIPYVMSDRVGEDANDYHLRAGVVAVAEKLMELRRL